MRVQALLCLVMVPTFNVVEAEPVLFYLRSPYSDRSLLGRMHRALIQRREPKTSRLRRMRLCPRQLEIQKQS
jgi:hypothetical protein